MRAKRIALNDAQRRSIGVRLESMSRRLGELREVGFESPAMAELEELMREFASRTDAIPSEPPRNFVQATLAQLWVSVMELRSRQIKSYGELDEHTAAVLDDGSHRLAEVVTKLLNEHERGRKGDAV